MTIITIDAVVSDGVLKPTTPLGLPEGTKVQAQIFVASSDGASANSLFGSYPQLSTLGDDDSAWAKRLWEQGFDRRAHNLSDSSKA